jgi:hypothetical protein
MKRDTDSIGFHNRVLERPLGCMKTSIDFLATAV